jgi:TPP-dependent pyruvate/acetoin dehydrogenase alpha subunit
LRARNGDGPSFIECKTYRIRGHAGAGSDAGLGYRSAEEVGFWESKCPVAAFREELLKEDLITQSDIQDMEKDIDLDIDEAFCFAQEGHLPEAANILQYLFSQ